MESNVLLSWRAGQCGARGVGLIIKIEVLRVCKNVPLRLQFSFFNGFVSVSVRSGEFPIGGLRGVCFEAEANITSEQGRGNKK
jgi:hypothetical protein